MRHTLFDVDQPTVAAQQHMHTPVAITNSRLEDIPDAFLKIGLPTPARLVVIGRCVNQKDPAGPPDRHIPFTACCVHQLALVADLTVFGAEHPAAWLCPMTGPPPASSACRSHLPAASARRISSGKSPSYFFFQLKYVAWLIPALQQISSTE